MSDTLFKWVKVETKNDLPELEWEGAFMLNGRLEPSTGWKVKWHFETYYKGGSKIEWLKEIKQPPTNIKIEIENIKSSAEQKKVGTRFPNEAFIEADAILMVCNHLLKFLDEREEIKQPVEEDKILKAIKKNAELKMANVGLNQENIDVNKALWKEQEENNNLQQQLREQIAGAAMNEQSLLELNRKIKENTIDKAIELITKEKSACQNTICCAGENQDMIYAMNNQIAAFEIALKHLESLKK